MENWTKRSDEELVAALRPGPWKESIPLGVLLVAATWGIGSTFYGAYWISLTYKPLGPFWASVLVLGSLLLLVLSILLSAILSNFVAQALRPKDDAPALIELRQRHGQGGFEFELTQSLKLFEQQKQIDSIFLIAGREADFHVCAKIEFNKTGQAIAESKVGPTLPTLPSLEDIKKILEPREKVPEENAAEIHKTLWQLLQDKKRKRRQKRARPDDSLQVQLAWLKDKKIQYFGWMFPGESAEKEAWAALHGLTLEVLRSTSSPEASRYGERVERALMKRGFFLQAEKLFATAVPCATGMRRSGDGPLRSWVGGKPVAPKGFVWPKRNNMPLSFLMQVSCAEAGMQGLTGSLAFFYDPKCHGLPPTEKGHCVVSYFSESDMTKAQTLDAPAEGNRVYQLMPLNVTPSASFPEKMPDFLRANLQGNYEGLRKDLRAPVQLLGVAHLEKTNETVEKNLCGQAYPGVTANDWTLLLQLHNASDIRWADSGNLNFYIPKSDLSAANFSRVCAVSSGGK